MTCHIALRGAAGTVVFSDSQASTQTAEAHGMQKQLVGDGFLLGASGSSLIINELFHRIQVAPQPVTAANVEATVTRFMRDEVDPGARQQAQWILARDGCPGVRTLYGGVLQDFLQPSPFGSIGSGSEFVVRALQRDTRVGVQRQLATLADTFVFVEGYADAANESLTVDNIYTIGFLVRDRSYLLAEAGVRPAYVHAAIAANWNLVTLRCREILAAARMIRSEIENAMRVFSSISRGELNSPTVAAIENSRLSIATNRLVLDALLTGYMGQYDAWLGRPPPAGAPAAPPTGP